ALPPSGPRARFSLRFECPRRFARAELDHELFFAADPTQLVLVKIETAGGLKSGILTTSARRLRIDQTLSRLEVVTDYLRLGLRHIFGGADHVLFLLGLLFGAVAGDRRLRRVIGIVTAFTLAHSLTLVAAALHWV